MPASSEANVDAVDLDTCVTRLAVERRKLEAASLEALREDAPARAVERRLFMVKEFEQDPQADIWLFLDAESGIQASLPDEETSPGSSR